jgi:hypothetical protein
LIDDQKSLDLEIVPWAENMKIGSKYVQYEEAESPTKIKVKKMSLGESFKARMAKKKSKPGKKKSKKGK